MKLSFRKWIVVVCTLILSILIVTVSWRDVPDVFAAEEKPAGSSDTGTAPETTLSDSSGGQDQPETVEGADFSNPAEEDQSKTETGEGKDDSKDKEPDSAADKAAKEFSDKIDAYGPRWLRMEVFGTEIWRFLAAFVLILLGFVVRKISDYVFVKRVIPMLEKSPFKFDNLVAEAISKPIGLLFLIFGFSAAFSFLGLPETPNVKGFAFGLIKVLIATDILWLLMRSVDVIVEYIAKLTARTDSTLDDQLLPMIRKSLKITIGIIIGIWVIQLLGYSVSSLIAGLGIGGLAVALAFQDTLANFFGSVFIFTDRPFKVGHLVNIGGVEGTVEQIGFRTTKIRTYPATLVSIPNKTVAESVIDNISKRPMRRVLQNIGVTYETTADQMEQAVAAITQILKTSEFVSQEFMVIRFNDFGDSSLDIQVIYFIMELDYAPFMEKKEKINLEIMRAIEKLGLSIAFPTRTIYFEGDIAKRMAGKTDAR